MIVTLPALDIQDCTTQEEILALLLRAAAVRVPSEFRTIEVLAHFRQLIRK